MGYDCPLLESQDIVKSGGSTRHLEECKNACLNVGLTPSKNSDPEVPIGIQRAGIRKGCTWHRGNEKCYYHRIENQSDATRGPLATAQLCKTNGTYFNTLKIFYQKS